MPLKVGPIRDACYTLVEGDKALKTKGKNNGKIKELGLFAMEKRGNYDPLVHASLRQKLLTKSTFYVHQYTSYKNAYNRNN